MWIAEKFNKIYSEYYRKRFKKSSQDLLYHPKDSTFEFSKIELGKRVFINRRAYFSAPNGEIVIGDNVLIGSDVFMAAGHHAYTQIGKYIRDQGYDGPEQCIIIDDDVWIASKVVILGNVYIGEGTVVGAASMVLSDLPSYCLCIGNPCRPIKKRYSDVELEEHLLRLGKSEDTIRRIIFERNDYLKDKTRID